MKRIWILPLIVAIVGLIYLALSKEKPPKREAEPPKEIEKTSPLSYQVDPKVYFPQIHRLGINAATINPVFWDSVVGPSMETIKDLRPSFIRTSLHSPAFLAACEELQSNPWIVLPDNLTEEDLRILSTFLKEHADQSKFSEVAIELKDSTSSDSIFSTLTTLASPSCVIRKVFSLRNEIPLHVNFDTLALVENTLMEATALDTLFQEKALPLPISLKPLKKTFAIYEERPLYNPLNYATGAAFAKKTLEQLSQGALYQLPFFDETASPYSTPVTLAAILLNQVLTGSLHQVKASQESPITLFAFRTKEAWNLALVNESNTPQQVTILFPEDDRSLPQVVSFLSAPSPLSHNDEIEEVTIASLPLTTTGRELHYTVVPYSFCCFTQP